MISNTDETKKQKLARAMDVISDAVKKLNSGDNTSVVCPICGNELVIYKPFKKRFAAKCKSDSCIKIWD